MCRIDVILDLGGRGRRRIGLPGAGGVGDDAGGVEPGAGGAEGEHELVGLLLEEGVGGFAGAGEGVAGGFGRGLAGARRRLSRRGAPAL